MKVSPEERARPAHRLTSSLFEDQQIEAAWPDRELTDEAIFFALDGVPKVVWYTFAVMSSASRP